MAGVSDLFGRHGVIEQLLLWGVFNQVIGAAESPFLTALTQDVNQAHPVTALPPSVAADLAVRGLLPEAEAVAEAARGGISAARFAAMVNRAKVRIAPADVAAAILRSYMPRDEGLAEVEPQGVDARRLGILTDLAGDAPGPTVLAQALRRRLIPRAGRGRGATSYEQGIAESRLHDKWGPLLADLETQLASPAQLAEGVVRNFTTRPDAEADAALQGVSAALLSLLVNLAGDAPAPGQLAEALRRGIVPRQGRGPGSVAFEQGIAEGRLADKWAPVIEGLSRLWPTPTDALEALLKGQLPDAEGRAMYERLGGDPQFIGWLLDTIGNSPTPLEASAMAARGIIAERGTGPEVLSYEQAVRESRYRNKWGPAYRAVSRHLPPPSTVATFTARGVITDQQAHTWLAENDLAPEVTAAYLADAEFTETSDLRGLTAGSVVSMYVAGLLDRSNALTVLGGLHVSPRAAALQLDYADLRYYIDSINRSVQRIATLLVSRKITVATATTAFQRLGVPPASVDKLITNLQLQAQADVKTLTAAEILAAAKYTIMTPAEALEDLQAIGYTAYDAWVKLSIEARGPLPDQPPRLVGAPPGPVIPGVT